MNYKNILISLIFIVFLNCKNNKDEIVKSKVTVEHSNSVAPKKEQNRYELKSILGK